MSLTLPALQRSHPGANRFTLNTPEISLSDTGYTCIVGRNGSGKSTFGETLASLDDKSQTPRWYYLPQYIDRFLYAENVLEQLGTMLSQRIDRNYLIEVMGDLGFSNPQEILDFPFILMSGGERRRIALACVFYLQPKYLILDEPDIGITEKENVVLLRKIGNLKAVKTRIVLISHNSEFVRASSDLICLLEGAVDRYGLTQELLNEPDFSLKKYGVRF